jgi:hypothetical protein
MIKKLTLKEVDNWITQVNALRGQDNAVLKRPPDIAKILMEGRVPSKTPTMRRTIGESKNQEE